MGRGTLEKLAKDKLVSYFQAVAMAMEPWSR
jgi:hypothetical protein